MTCVRMAGLIGLLCTMLTFGQETKRSSASNSPQTQTGPTFRIDVELVLLNATVMAGNRYVSGLGQEHFRVWEDKIEQQIEYFSSEHVPISAGIIFDVSGSMERKLGAARAAASTFMKMGDQGDEYFLLEFSDSPRLLEDFTTDITKLQDRLLFTRAKGKTSLYDALYAGLDRVSRGSNSRKALLLISDGEDNHSRYSYSDVRTYARERDVAIYSIGIIDEENPHATYSGRPLLEDLAKLTGGVAFFPGSLGALDNICAQIGADLKNQYTLGYRSSNPSKDGKWRKIRVKMNTPKGIRAMSVRAKSGYFAPATAKVTN